MVVRKSSERRIRSVAGSTARRSGGQLGAALASPSSEDRSTRPGAHTQPEAVSLGSAPVVRLEGALGHVRLQVGSCHRHDGGQLRLSRRHSAERVCAHAAGSHHACTRATQQEPSRTAVQRYASRSRGVKRGGNPCPLAPDLPEPSRMHPYGGSASATHRARCDGLVGIPSHRRARSARTLGPWTALMRAPERAHSLWTTMWIMASRARLRHTRRQPASTQEP